MSTDTIDTNALDVIANFETDSPHDVAMEALAAGGAVSERIEDSGRQHRRAAMRKRNGWCIWSPWSGYLSSTFASTRTECIKVFERDSNSPWRRYREQGFECRPVLFVDARNESGDA